MSTPLKKVVDDQLDASGMAGEPLDAADAKYVAAGVKSVLSSLRARRAWENHIGAVLTHKQALHVTGWSKQALSQAVREHRVLQLKAAEGTAGYWSGGLTDTDPHVPILGIKGVLGAWAHADVEGWTIASWMSSPQPELGGRTPRQALVDGDTSDVVTLAQQASARLVA
ncbi:hypothetical protein ERC79_13460 [Rhodococcus sp. ABRD24]|uniref:hypothetical protein n=1 Tax=Rhodococcus sp. ABRD24 TaxID=2507582 RepID=UPI00103B5AAF|nr:hypothetical protein [Rhodococcus sp. ABRD24]QBJ96847.1 hypothetical protein ERC79_13460 [Rhodococcus sp. ABRD24]